MKKSGIFLSLAAALVCSCTGKAPAGDGIVPLVREILSDRTSPEHGLLSSFSEPDPVGEIFIIGPEEGCLSIAEAMFALDQRDNVDAKPGEDGLKDFAGETMACIIDTMSYSYPELISERKEYTVRERVVRMCLSAIDTVGHLSPYDIDGMASKAPAKVIVLADPLVACYGKADVDTLLHASGCGIPALSPLDVMFDDLFESAAGRQVKAGIICEPRFAGSGAYLSRFESAMRRHGAEGSGCVVLPGRGKEGVVKAFLDDYMAAGGEQPLDFIVVDDPTLNMQTLKSELAGLISIMNEESMVYGRFIAPDFSFIDPASSVSRKCYDILRKSNLFTHNIAQPQIVTYAVAPSPNADDGSILLIPGTYVQN